MTPHPIPKGTQGLSKVTLKQFFSQPMPDRKRLKPHQRGPIGEPILESWRSHLGAPSLVRGCLWKKKVEWDHGPNQCKVANTGKPNTKPKTAILGLHGPPATMWVPMGASVPTLSRDDNTCIHTAWPASNKNTRGTFAGTILPRASRALLRAPGHAPLLALRQEVPSTCDSAFPGTFTGTCPANLARTSCPESISAATFYIL